MSPALNIIITDIKNILRDPSLVMMLFVPFLITALLRWGYPYFLEAVPEATEYNMLVLAMLAMTSGAMPGMALAFAILDEKDNGLLPALMILPVSFRKIVLNRIWTISIYGTFAALITIGFSGLSEASLLQNLLLSLLAASTAAAFGMVPAFFAANKIEGATLAKILNFLLVFPLPAFIFSGWWTSLLGVFPAWWVYSAFTSTTDPVQFLTSFGWGIAYHLLITIIVTRQIFSRVANQD
ncbi:MAG: hypothetical protein EA408_12985 [Marinilabiliales bacterium]|nr:MAG: hypothetical protein EA408_12985 [Marinilabiliales bacterium]